METEAFRKKTGTFKTSLRRKSSKVKTEDEAWSLVDAMAMTKAVVLGQVISSHGFGESLINNLMSPIGN